MMRYTINVLRKQIKWVILKRNTLYAALFSQRWSPGSMHVFCLWLYRCEKTKHLYFFSSLTDTLLGHRHITGHTCVGEYKSKCWYGHLLYHTSLNRNVFLQFKNKSLIVGNLLTCHYHSIISARMNTLLNRRKLFNVCSDGNAYLVYHEIFQYVSEIRAINLVCISRGSFPFSCAYQTISKQRDENVALSNTWLSCGLILKGLHKYIMSK